MTETHPRHGSLGGYNRHRTLKEEPCEACRIAKALHDKARQSEPAQTLKNRRAARAQSRAYRRLAQLHPGLYRRFYLEEKAILEQEDTK